MKSFNEACEHVIEELNSRSYTVRQYYPRDLKLSREFTHALEKEWNRLSSETEDGMTSSAKKKLLGKIQKAISFHCKC